MYASLAEQASESDWSQEERDQRYKERPKDEEYYRIQRELLKDGLTRKAKLVKLPPHQEGEPGLWAIGLEGASPLKLPAAEQHPLHASLAFDDELSEEQLQALQDEWGEERDVTFHFHKFTSGGSGELSLKWDPVANSESVQRAQEASYYGQRRPLHISF